MKRFAAAHYWLWNHCKNATVLGDQFGICERYVQGKDFWIWIRCIASLEKKVIVWIKSLDLEDSEIQAISIDGVDKKTWERKHETQPKDRKNYTQKFNHAGLKYQITLASQRKKCVNIYGPVRGGMSDKEMLACSGVMERLRKGKLACADQGYIDHWQTQISWPNPQDSKATNNFKSRIRMRHETFNGKMAHYASMYNTWRHSDEQHGWAFRAIAMTIQYALDNGSTDLFQP